MRRAAGIAVVATAAVAALVWSWGTWPNARVDFGREIYVPWQLSLGRVLYRDVAYLNGPIAPYVNALGFRVFGASVSTLVAMNVALVAILLAVTMRLLRAIASWGAVIVAALVFVTVFGFAHLLPVGNYNWMCPYSHDVTYGIVLAFGALAFVARYARSRRSADLFGAGLLTGMALLTKGEVLVACLASVGSSLALLATGPSGSRLRIRDGAALAGGVLIAPAIAFVSFATVLPMSDVLRGPIGHPLVAWRVGAGSMEFYRRIMGTFDTAGSLRSVAAWSLGWIVVLGLPALAAWRSRAPARRPYLPEWVAILATGGVLLVAGPRIAWLDVARPLPLMMAALAVLTLFRQRAPERGEADASRAVVELGLIVLSLALLAKMILRVGLGHYGFALAMPATLVTVVVVVDWIPAALDRAGRRGSLFRAAALGAVASLVVACLRISAAHMAAKDTPVGRGPDAFRGRPVDSLIAQTVDELERRMGPGATVAVLPEGALINFLLRRPNPTPYVFLAPLDLAVFGEGAVLAAYRRAPPDFMVLAHRDTSEYGVRFFGRDYARDLVRWIAGRYTPEVVIGAPPFQDDRVGLMILRRRATGTSATASTP